MGACSSQAPLVPGQAAGQEEDWMSRALRPGGPPVQPCKVTVGTLLQCTTISQTGFKIKGLKPMLTQRSLDKVLLMITGPRSTGV